MDDFANALIIVILLVKVAMMVFIMLKIITFDIPLKVIFSLIIVSLITDTVSYILSWLDYKTAIPVNMYTVIEGLIIMSFYKLTDEKFAFPLGGLLFISIALIEWIVFTQNTRFLDITTVAEATFFIIFSLRFFMRTLGELKVGRLRNYPYFWINCGILFYFAGSLFLFAFGDLIVSYSIMFLWNLHNFIQIIYLLLISIAFWKVRLIQI